MPASASRPKTFSVYNKKGSCDKKRVPTYSKIEHNLLTILSTAKIRSSSEVSRIFRGNTSIPLIPLFTLHLLSRVERKSKQHLVVPVPPISTILYVEFLVATAPRSIDRKGIADDDSECNQFVF